MKKIFSIFNVEADYKSRVFGLDLMRAIAIIFVVMGHGLMLNKANTNFPWIKLINGVELFFVLSGFLIGRILLNQFLQNDTFSKKEIVHFWIRRWFRTLPAYYLVLILNIVFIYFGIIGGDFAQFSWKFFLFLHNFSKPFTGFFWESWSLSIEEWFYFLFPMGLAMLFLLSKKGTLSKKYIFLMAIVLFLLMPFLLRYFYASTFEVDSFWLDNKIFKVVIFRMDGIALGLLAAFIKSFYQDFWFKWRNVLFVAGIVISYTLLYTTWPPNNFSTKVYKVLIQSLGCLFLLPKFDSIKTAPLLITKIVTHISLISYSMYLINLALVAQVINDNMAINSPIKAWMMYIVFWIAIIGFSTLMYKYFEKPMTDLRDKIGRS
jgi:peptidoglycan/LPS O-acetylase OafA/YrhL